MRIEDARKLIAVLMVSYPNYKPIDAELAAETWSGITEEYTYEQVDMALRNYMKSDTSGFAPTPGQIIDKIHTISTPQELNEMEAWSVVSRAIRNSGYNSVEEFSKLPKLVQKAVGLPDQLRTWALDENFNEVVVSSNFIKCYRSVVERETEIRKMPVQVQAMIQKRNETSYSGQIEAERRNSIESSSERIKAEIKALEAKEKSVDIPDDYVKKKESIFGKSMNFIKRKE